MNNKQNKDIKIGFTKDSETWNGRVAMISFTLIVVIEIIAQKPILVLLNLR
uniref:CAB/ELIP/HLIP superfamily protein n=1 Tax=Erythrotrichia carnea TaxID=35151 RepID=A0A1C9CEQ3_9RHOD|nr:CAB/ELIP/HLIP superfamily protein [Erythrotrichia carnea]AOM66824.1 CAB/ELIP/HLIP superfamily protein [Erythrotrichia carnea]